MSEEGYYSSLMERIRDQQDELDAQKWEEERIKRDKEDPRKKMMDDIIGALAPCTNHRVSDDIQVRVGMMVRAEQITAGDEEPPMAVVVVDHSPSFGPSKLKVPLTELGVGEMIFVSRESRLGEEIIKKAIQTDGIGELSFFTEGSRFGRAKITWNVTALYDPQQTREIILKHLEEVAV